MPGVIVQLKQMEIIACSPLSLDCGVDGGASCHVGNDSSLLVIMKLNESQTMCCKGFNT
jgi:hypothetical protein